MHINRQIITLMRADPTRDRWTPLMLSQHLGLTSEEVQDATAKMQRKGQLKKVDANAYALSARMMAPTPHPDPADPRTTSPKPTKAQPAGPCPQSDALLRLMRGTGGSRSIRAWGALWMERDTLTGDMLTKLKRDRLVIQEGQLWRVAR